MVETPLQLSTPLKPGHQPAPEVVEGIGRYLAEKKGMNVASTEIKDDILTYTLEDPK